MKKFMIMLLPFVFFLMPPSTEAQAVRNAKSQIVEKTAITKRGQRRRSVRRFRRRRHRRVYRRTLRNIPAGSTAVVYAKTTYYPVNGFYYVANKGTYIAVAPPVGFRMARMPWTLRPLTVRNTNYFYANGIYYSKSNDGYKIVAPPKGAKVEALPEETTKKVIDGKTYYLFDGSLYAKQDETYELVGFE